MGKVKFLMLNGPKKAKKIAVSEVFDAKRAPPIVLVTQRATETTLMGLQPSDILYQPKTTNLNEP